MIFFYKFLSFPSVGFFVGKRSFLNKIQVIRLTKRLESHTPGITCSSKFFEFEFVIVTFSNFFHFGIKMAKVMKSINLMCVVHWQEIANLTYN